MLATLKILRISPARTTGSCKGIFAIERSLNAILKDEKPWAVVNFAAESHVDRSILDASPFLQTNIAGVQTLLEAIRNHPVERFLHISTDEVYGDKEGKESSSEESPLLPSSPYAATKAAADLLCFSYRRTYGLPIIVTRSSNNYGPYQFPEKLIPLLIRNGLNNLELPIYGDGKQIRDGFTSKTIAGRFSACLKRGETARSTISAPARNGRISKSSEGNLRRHGGTEGVIR